MDWSAFLGGAFVLLLAIGVLQTLWHVLIILVLLGPPTLLGLGAGHFVADQFNNTPVGILTAVVVGGVLSEATTRAARRLRSGF